MSVFRLFRKRADIAPILPSERSAPAPALPTPDLASDQPYARPQPHRYRNKAKTQRK